MRKLDTLYNVLVNHVAEEKLDYPDRNLPEHVSLDIFNESIQTQNISFEHFISIVPKIEKLDLSLCNSFDPTWLSRSKTELHNITSINLSGCTNSDFLTIISDTIGNSLQELIIDECPNLLESVPIFPKKLKNLSMQHALFEGFPNMSRTKIQMIPSLPKTLESLNLSGYDCRSPGFLLELIHLKTLSLSKCNLRNADLANIDEILVQLKILDLSCNPLITEDLFRYFNPISKDGMRLDSLNLSFTGVASVPDSLQRIENLVLYKPSNLFDINMFVENFRGTKLWYDKEGSFSFDIFEFFGDRSMSIPFLCEYVRLSKRYVKRNPTKENCEKHIKNIVYLLSKHLSSKILVIHIFSSLYKLFKHEFMVDLLIEHKFVSHVMKLIVYLSSVTIDTNFTGIVHHTSFVICRLAHFPILRPEVDSYNGYNKIAALLAKTYENQWVSEYLASCLANFLVGDDSHFRKTIHVEPVVKTLVKIMETHDYSLSVISSTINCLGNLTCYYSEAAILFVELGGLEQLSDILEEYMSRDNLNGIGIVTCLLWNLAENDAIRIDILNTLKSQLVDCFSRYKSEFTIIYSLAITFSNLILNETIQRQQDNVVSLITNLLIDSVTRNYLDMKKSLSLLWGWLDPLWPLMKSNNLGVRYIGYFVYCHQTTMEAKIGDLLVGEGHDLFQKMIKYAKQTKNHKIMEWCKIAYQNFLSNGKTRDQLDHVKKYFE